MIMGLQCVASHARHHEAVKDKGKSANGLCGKEDRTEPLGILEVCEIASSSTCRIRMFTHTGIIKLFSNG